MAELSPCDKAWVLLTFEAARITTTRTAQLQRPQPKQPLLFAFVIGFERHHRTAVASENRRDKFTRRWVVAGLIADSLSHQEPWLPSARLLRNMVSITL